MPRTILCRWCSCENGITNEVFDAIVNVERVDTIERQWSGAFEFYRVSVGWRILRVSQEAASDILTTRRSLNFSEANVHEKQAYLDLCFQKHGW